MNMQYEEVSEGITHVIFTAKPEEEVEFIDTVPNYHTGNVDVFVADGTCGSFNLTPTHKVKLRRDFDPIVPPEPYRAIQDEEIEPERVNGFIVKHTIILVADDAPITKVVDTASDDLVLAGKNILFAPEERENELRLVCLKSFSIENTTKSFLEDSAYPEPDAYEYVQWLVDNNYAKYMIFDVALYEANA